MFKMSLLQLWENFEVSTRTPPPGEVARFQNISKTFKVLRVRVTLTQPLLISKEVSFTHCLITLFFTNLHTPTLVHFLSFCGAMEGGPTASAAQAFLSAHGLEQRTAAFEDNGFDTMDRDDHSRH